jgi:spore maturation protein SpmA
MMNYIWLSLLGIALVIGIITGQIAKVTEAAFDSAASAVNISLGLIGIMTLWLGIMKIAEEAGLVQLIARLIRPISIWLFPEIPPDHPANGSIVLNLAASWLGLGNAATPFGIKAMEHLQSLNDQKDTATNSMIMFLAMNTASITIIPITIIGVRTELGSAHPTEIIGSTIFSSVIATITAILTVKTIIAFQNTKFRVLDRFKSWKVWLGILFVIGSIMILISDKTRAPLWNFISGNTFRAIIQYISTFMIPFLLCLILTLAALKKVKMYEIFIEGAKEGFQVAIRIIPFLVAILVAVGMLRASGALQFFVTILSPVTSAIGMPADVLPAALMRPLSGSGSLAIITELMQKFGPDSFIGRLASTIYGCTETTFYVIAVYFGAVQIKKIRFSIVAGLMADVAGILAAVFICRILFLP